MRTQSPVVLIAFIALIACADRAPNVATVADSAGIRIITHPSGSLETVPVWELSASPTIQIGAGADPDIVLFGVADVVPFGDDRVAISTNGPPQVRLFGPNGKHLATLGRSGDGPGEFMSVGSVVPLGSDSLAVWDPDRRRVSVFTSEGRLVREVDLREIAPPTVAGAPGTSTDAGFTHVLSGPQGLWFLFSEAVFSSTAVAGIHRPSLPAHLLSTDGTEQVRFEGIPGMSMYTGGPMGTLPLPLGARTHAAASRGHLIVGTGETTEYRVYSPTGELVQIVRWPEHDRSVDGPHLSAWWSMVDSVPGTRDLMELIPRPELLPAFDDLISADIGDVLVGDFAGPVGVWPTRRGESVPEMMKPSRRVPARRWLVFGSDGVLKASVTTPEGFEPYTLDGGLLWGVYTDGLDAESVGAYRLAE